MTVLEIAQKSKKASRDMVSFSSNNRNKALLNMATAIRTSKERIIEENLHDVQDAKRAKLSAAMIDRLILNAERIESMAQTCEQIAAQEEVVGSIVSEIQRPNGLIVKKERIPLGVIGMIFESRPNCVVDCSALAIKSGNAIILKGGKEAKFSNKILASIIREAITNDLPVDCVQLINSKEAVQELLLLNEYVDVMIPRGGEQLINYVYENAKMPVIAHFKGLCHLYIHSDADQDIATNLAINSKTHRPGVCNAIECVLLDKDLGEAYISSLLNLFQEKRTELRGCSATKKIIENITLASEDDYATEYLDNILSVKIVSGFDEAISHIQKFGTNHTETICTGSTDTAQKFSQLIDASCIMINASSRFNDGGELGLGAELGISTSKFHAYGPMGACEMTTTRFLVVGNGQIRN
jgi:glutamate-5-semialdehyde dehydrogenase